MLLIRLLIWLLLGLLLTVGVTPVLSQIPVINPMTQEQIDALQLMGEGEQYYQAEQFSAAVEKFKQAAEIFASKKKELEQAIALSNLSLAEQKLGQWDEAKDAINNSFKLLGITPDCRTIANQSIADISSEKLRILAPALNIYGRFFYEQGQPSCALPSWRLATNIFAQQNEPTRAIASQINQVQALQALGLYQDAKATIEAVERNLAPIESPKIKIRALLSLGDVLRAIGDLKHSQQKLEAGLSLAESLESRSEISAAFLGLGNTFLALGNLERERKAPIKYEYEYLPVSSQYKTSTDENRDNYGSQFYKKAEENYKCVVINQTLDATANQPCTSPQKIEIAYQEVIRGKSSVSAIATKAQLNLLSLFLETGKWQPAKELASAINLSHLPESRTRIYAEINLAKSLAYLQTLQSHPSWDDIINPMKTAAQEATELEDRQAKSYALGNLGGLYEYLGQNQHQTSPVDWLQIAQKLTQEALYLAQPKEASDIAYQWQWQLGRLLNAQGKREEAIAAYEAAVKTLAAVRGDLLTINPDVQFSFRDNIEPIYRELVTLLLSLEATKPSQKNLQKSLYYLESLQLAELENFLQCNLQTFEAVKTNLPKFSDEPTAALSERIDQVLQTDPTAALVYPILLKEQVAVILKLPGRELIYHSNPISQNEVESILLPLRDYLKDPSRTKKIQELSSSLYRWLIEPFETQLQVEADLEKAQVKTLVFLLDGALRNIPMAVLYDQKRNRYLLERYAVALSSGLQLLVPERPPQAINALIGGLSEEREFGGQIFSSLKNVPEELKEIQSVVPSRELLNGTFTKPNLEVQLNSDPFSIVHLATHGQFSSDPEETFIILSDERVKAKELNNLLRLENINKATRIELLVLSACETATGDRRAALGLAGVALRAGARSTLATLWQVSDQSTSELMSQFYRQVKENRNISKAQALRRVQLALWQRKDKDWKRPFFWGAYVLVGNWQ